MSFQFPLHLSPLFSNPMTRTRLIRLDLRCHTFSTAHPALYQPFAARSLVRSPRAFPDHLVVSCLLCSPCPALRTVESNYPPIQDCPARLIPPFSSSALCHPSSAPSVDLPAWSLQSTASSVAECWPRPPRLAFASGHVPLLLEALQRRARPAD